MTFLYQESRNGNYGKGDIWNDMGVVGELFERTVDITDDRNSEDDMNPAQNRALGGVSHEWFRLWLMNQL
jgi:hypothetical protein